MYDTARMVVVLSAFWWIASLVLITLSAVLLHATWTGQERVFSIGKKAATEREDAPRPRCSKARTSNIVVGYVGFSVGLVIIFILVS